MGSGSEQEFYCTEKLRECGYGEWELASVGCRLEATASNILQTIQNPPVISSSSVNYYEPPFPHGKMKSRQNIFSAST